MNASVVRFLALLATGQLLSLAAGMDVLHARTSCDELLELRGGVVERDVFEPSADRITSDGPLFDVDVPLRPADPDLFGPSVFAPFDGKAGLTGHFPQTALLFRNQGRSVIRPGCTATLIGRRTVLSAAHCFLSSDASETYREERLEDFHDPARQRDRLKPWSVFFPHAGVFSPVEVRIPKTYDASTFEADLAIVKLDREVRGIAPVELAGDDTPERVTIVGFGAGDLKRPYNDSFIKRCAVVPLGPCPGDASIPSDSLCFDFVQSRPRGTPFHSCTRNVGNICHGDSGGPLFDTTGGDPRLVGVISRSDRVVANLPPSLSDSLCWLPEDEDGVGALVERSYAIDVDAHRPWIEQWTKRFEGGTSVEDDRLITCRWTIEGYFPDPTETVAAPAHLADTSEVCTLPPEGAPRDERLQAFSACSVRYFSIKLHDDTRGVLRLGLNAAKGLNAREGTLTLLESLGSPVAGECTGPGACAGSVSWQSLSENNFDLTVTRRLKVSRRATFYQARRGIPASQKTMLLGYQTTPTFDFAECVGDSPGQIEYCEIDLDHWTSPPGREVFVTVERLSGLGEFQLSVSLLPP